MGDVIFGLMLWLWLQKESIGMFARECLQDAMGKDVLYDRMNREDLNWRRFHEQVAHKTIQTFKASGKKAYVVAKCYRTAQKCTKPEMVNAMVKRALNAGTMADYLVLSQSYFDRYNKDLRGF